MAPDIPKVDTDRHPDLDLLHGTSAMRCRVGFFMGIVSPIRRTCSSQLAEVNVTDVSPTNRKLSRNPREGRFAEASLHGLRGARFQAPSLFTATSRQVITSVLATNRESSFGVRPNASRPIQDVTILRNHEPHHRSSCHRQGRANQHDNSESKYKCFLDGALNRDLHTRIQAGGNLQAGEFDLVCMKLPQNAQRQREVSQGVVEPETERLHHHNPENCNSKYTSYACYSIVDSR